VQPISLNINTMQILWNHRFGQQEQQPLVVCRPWAFADEYEDGEMLESGWLLLDHEYQDRECWYQCRSVRIDSEAYRPRFDKHEYQGEPITMRQVMPKSVQDLKLLPLKKIYDAYIRRKGFRDMYDPFQYLGPRCSFLLFEISGDVVGFTKIRNYYWQEDVDYTQMTLPLDGPDWEPMTVAGIETVTHASTVPISQITADMEIQWAIKHGACYVYLGAGYERGSEYKASFRGFEWWTGEQWSTAKKTYKKLCKRDSDLTVISDLRNAK